MWWTIFLNWKNDVMIVLGVCLLACYVWAFTNYSRIEPLKATIKVKEVEIVKLNEDKQALQVQIDSAAKVIGAIKNNDRRLSALAQQAQQTQSLISGLNIPILQGVENEIPPASNDKIVALFNISIARYNDRVYKPGQAVPTK
jgi:hypothetical protein